jgi:phage/conjugal plasmid C-4 type zinc finger TraR family protein
MPDDLDLTEAREAALIAARVAHAQRQVQPLPEPARECCDCGNLIPELRREKMPSARRCVPCQQAWEAGR